MALKRGVALGVFTIGLVVVAIALFGCGGEADDLRVDACPDANSSLRIAGIELARDGESLRFAYAGAEPCQFAVDLHAGTLYAELRTATSLTDVDRDPPVPSGCAIGRFERPVKPGTPVGALGRTGRLVPDVEVQRLLSSESECLEIEEGQPAFIID